MPLYLNPGTSSLLGIGSSLAGSSDCCCGDDFDPCGCTGDALDDFKDGGGSFDVQVSATGSGCGSCVDNLPGLYSLPSHTSGQCDYTHPEFFVPTGCFPSYWQIRLSFEESGGDYYIKVTLTFNTIFGGRQVIFKKNMGPDGISCAMLSGEVIPYDSVTGSWTCDWSAVTVTVTAVP